MRLKKLVYDPYDDRDMTENPNGLLLRSHADVDFLKSIPKSKVACIDVETTGVNPGNDEILQVSICNGDGIVLLDSYVHPERRKRWPKAQEVNHITWAMVRDAPTMEDLAAPICAILDECELVIGYNILRFDIPFLNKVRIDIPCNKYVYDLIYDCAVLHGRWSETHCNYSFAKLETVARKYGITYEAHNSANDAVATTKLFYALLDGDAMREKVDHYEHIAEERAKKEELAKQARIAEQQELHKNLIAAQQNEKSEASAQPQKNAPSNTTRGCGCIVIVALLILLVMLMSCTRH